MPEFNQRQIGVYGEAIARRYLELHGHAIIKQNYRKKGGEIDIIAQQGATIHFVEVKANVYRSRAELKDRGSEVHNLVERVTPKKYKRLVQTIKQWLQEERYPGIYQLDLITVRLVPDEQYALVEYFENIVVD